MRHVTKAWAIDLGGERGFYKKPGPFKRSKEVICVSMFREVLKREAVWLLFMLRDQGYAIRSKPRVVRVKVTVETC